jgi:hypothetical protein
MISKEEISIKNLVKNIEIIEKNDCKEEFVNNYNKLKEDIDNIDKILKKENKKEDKIIRGKNINELYEMLESFNSEQENDIDAEKLRKMKIILDTIEIKIEETGLIIEKVK